MKITIRGLDKAVSQLEKYRQSLDTKIDELLERLAIIGAYRARIDFTGAMYAGANDTEVSVEKTKHGFKIVAKGQAVIFIEFGTGIINPEHPKSADFGFSHGTYGDGKGSNPKGWVYVGEQGNAGQFIRDGVFHTYGNPPARAMYNAAEEVRRNIQAIAKEVFG